MIRAGTLNKSITFQINTPVSDGMGPGGTDAWADSFSTRAAIWPVKAAERIEGMRVSHSVTHKIRVRYRSSITPTMRIRFGARIFDIKAIINIDEANRVLEILAVEKS